MGRFGAAWSAFWNILRSEDVCERWQQLQERQLTEGVALEEEAAEAPAEAEAETSAKQHADAVYTLVLLQRSGRLVDFLEEDIDAFSDAQVGAAVRQIHAGCRKVLSETFGLEPIQGEAEGAAVTVEEGFDPRTLRITGRPQGSPPYRGSVTHRGWQATKVDLPERHEDLDAYVVCPAEVEV